VPVPEPIPLPTPQPVLRTTPITSPQELDTALASYTRGQELAAQIGTRQAELDQLATAKRDAGETLSNAWDAQRRLDEDRARRAITKAKYAEQKAIVDNAVLEADKANAAALDAMVNAKAKAKTDAHDLLRADLPVQIFPKDKGMNPQSQKALSEATEFVRKTLAAIKTPTGIQYGELKLDVTESWTERAYAQGNTISVDRASSASSVVHEIGHVIEHTVPGVQEAATAFLKKRTAGETLVKLKDVPANAGRGYGDSEVGRRFRSDAFPKEQQYYIGRDYGAAVTEVISMGLEKLYTDPVGFAAKDPEYFKFITGILDGTFRVTQ
jgi:hypothetical protein